MAISPAELFDRYHLVVFRYLLRMTGRADAAEDLAQDVFVRVVRGAETCEPGEGERAWLFRIARNLLIDSQRRASRNPVTATDDPARGEQGAGKQAGQAVGLEIQDALDRLAPADREVFLLRVAGGLSHEEIASLSGATLPAVRSRIFRARAALREMLRATGADREDATHKGTGTGVDVGRSSDRPSGVRRFKVVP